MNNAVARVAGLLGIAVVGAAIAGASNQLDMPGTGTAMAITAGLLVAGGAIGLAGIRRQRRGASTERQRCAERAAEIVFDRVTKRYAGPRGAPRCTTSRSTIPAGTFCVLVGPSGGGKTTALKLVNRLIPFDEGDIRIDGRSIRDLPAVELRRGIGYVIQQVGLFPHMTIGDNIATVPQLLGWPKARIRERDGRAARARRPRAGRRAALPGAALGRPAPARRPRPRARRRSAGAADGRAVRRARPDHARPAAAGAAPPAREVAKTIIFVTHDIDEAITMGDRIAILREGGVLAQYDTPDAILAHPADEFVAQFIGEDRALRRLALRRVGEIELDPVADPDPPSFAAVGRDHGAERGLADARERRPTGCSSSATTAQPLGVLTPRARRGAAAADRRRPDRSSRTSARAARASRGDHVFCWDWVREHWGDTLAAGARRSTSS